MDLGSIGIPLAAFGGGIVSALLGWMRSEENFIARKFGTSLLRASLAGGVVAASYPLLGEITMPVIIGAFLAGAGIDVTLHRAAGSIKS